MTVNESTGIGCPRMVCVELRPLVWPRPGAARHTLAIAPRGGLFEIKAAPEDVAAVLDRCDGATPVDEIVRGTSDPAGYREVLEKLTELGGLSVEEPFAGEANWLRFEQGARPDPGRVGATPLILTGDAELTDVARLCPVTANFASIEVSSREGLADALAAHPAGKPVVLALRDRFDLGYLESLNDFCAEHRVLWSSFHLSEGRGWAGPTVAPGRTPDYRDLLGRRLTAAERPDVHAALTGEAVFGAGCGPTSSELLWMLSYLLIDVERWVAGVTAWSLWAEIELDPVELTVARHPVLPLPDRPLDDDTPPFNERLLLDNRTGLIASHQIFEHDSSVPDRLVTVQTNVADMRRLYTWANNVVCGGTAFRNFRAARSAAIGEAVERYCGNCITETVDVREASYQELERAGESALDPDRLVLYSDRLYDSPGFPFVRFTHDRTTHWVPGHSLTADRPVWVPASLVYVNWYMDQYANVPPTNFLYYPGLAAGHTLDAALVSGIEEVIERDATMIWWMNRQPLPKVEAPPELAALWAGRPAELGQRAWLIQLDNEFDVPVLAGVVENHIEKLFTIGFGARPDPVDAARKAWGEALTLQDGTRDFDDPEGLFRQAVAAGWTNAMVKPWRKDRAYLDDYAKDFRDVNDLLCQQQLFLDPRATEVVRPWVDTPTSRPVSALPRLPDRTLATYRDVVEKRGYEIIYVDVTTHDVAKTGFRVVRVLIPGLVPNFPAAFPFLGKRRIQDMAVTLGWRQRPLTEEELNYFPLPHA
ncbi:YcaO-like family protein [Streptomyces sp. NRRL B-1347]|uniref:YcaO-like family protein n=1 Tax=Streptomyces sp. NRRL B-1347 TaxID=1476877 RepID=UPI00131E0C6B|nr:YcaO-like family protein [Streptomyces sp. NRRL B-1347]